MWVCRSIFNGWNCRAFDSLAPACSPFGLLVCVARRPPTSFCETPMSKGVCPRRPVAITLKCFYRLRFFHFLTTLFASPTRVVAPEFEHCLAKVVDNVFAIEVDVFHQCSTIFTVENDMLLFTRRSTPLHYQANGVGRTLG